jgi:two-component system, OmpR family, alkaline phosphatase synthesis response regulator PhoP
MMLSANRLSSLPPQASQLLIASKVPLLKGNSSGNRCGIIAIAEPLNLIDEEMLFTAGIDLLITRPMAIRSIEFRIQALANRIENKSQMLKFGPVELIESLSSVTIGSTTKIITPTQFQILKCLLLNQDNLTSREAIRASVWPNRKVSLRSIDAHISKIKKALPELEGLIQKIYRRGYRFSLLAKAA